MIVGIGTDLVKTARIHQAIERWGERFLRKILTASELEQYHEGRGATFVAKRFAAKEAAAKALGTGMSLGVGFTQIGVVGKRGYPPQLVLTGAAQRRAEALGVQRMLLSLSDEQDHALAFVVAEGGPE